MNLHPLLLAAALPLLTLAGPAGADPMRLSVAALSLDHLKATYLACDKLATETLLAAGDYQRCALVGDELLERGFDGDFDRLLAWWRVEKVRFAKTATEPALRR